jgi:hypothetical protein
MPTEPLDGHTNQQQPWRMPYRLRLPLPEFGNPLRPLPGLDECEPPSAVPGGTSRANGGRSTGGGLRLPGRYLPLDQPVHFSIRVVFQSRQQEHIQPTLHLHNQPRRNPLLEPNSSRLQELIAGEHVGHSASIVESIAYFLIGIIMDNKTSAGVFTLQGGQINGISRDVQVDGMK